MNYIFLTASSNTEEEGSRCSCSETICVHKVKKEAEGFRVTVVIRSDRVMVPCGDGQILVSEDINKAKSTYEKSCSLPVVQDFQSALSSAALQEKFLKVSDFAVNILCSEGPAASGNERKLTHRSSEVTRDLESPSTSPVGKPQYHRKKMRRIEGMKEPKGLQNLYQHRQTEPTDQESTVAPGRAAASLGGTTTSSTNAGADPGRKTATRCPCPSLAADLGNSKKGAQRVAASRRDPPKILRRPSLPARPGTGPTTDSTACSGPIAGRD
ncbi:hypothetical protein DAPPUDRAFT_105094 [Daphnia pulex]|uniref:Par3/HAL N-terminal domain-containing protein n=1 Tax=Daphnia pulex TaxID=6669 RepID=E9GPF3_DAPPU|nr:hypothetical protein DAPPUDRAFT_105094 [Daphnia pulex]|eukprot:EFX78632.1 hypothetical protein DAPPUDRAFT_105094 [Daphnia pulex]